MPLTDEPELVDPPGLWVRFTAQGECAWIGPEPIDGAEQLPYAMGGDEDRIILSVEFLVAHVRTPEGDWAPRPPRLPTEADLAEAARAAEEAEAQASAWRRVAIDEEVARRAQPDALLRAMGKITIAELNARVAAIRLEVEAGN